MSVKGFFSSFVGKTGLGGGMRIETEEIMELAERIWNA